jgi:hypothetical protein
MHLEAYRDEARGHPNLSKDRRNEENDRRNGKRGGEAWPEYFSQWRPVQQARNESEKKIQRRGGQARKVIQAHHGSTRDPAPKPIPNDERVDRQRDQITSRQKEENQRAWEDDWGTAKRTQISCQQDGTVPGWESIQYLPREEAERS